MSGVGRDVFTFTSGDVIRWPGGDCDDAGARCNELGARRQEAGRRLTRTRGEAAGAASTWRFVPGRPGGQNRGGAGASCAAAPAHLLLSRGPGPCPQRGSHLGIFPHII